jgi:1-acyl-sn-glycerol-3-phosphate acyltransferase
MKSILNISALEDEEFTVQLEELSLTEGVSVKDVRSRAQRLLSRLAGRHEPVVIWILGMLLAPLFRRIFNPISVKGLHKINNNSKDKTVILVPNHRSHADYLLLSFLFYKNNYQLPIIAAGDNLTFFPAGGILRRGGAFFIRRTLDEDILYRLVLKRYISYLVRTNAFVEFFIEGGRSRLGLVRRPRLGLLKYILEAARTVQHLREVEFVPVSIAYEHIPEENSLSTELSGAEKKKESFFQLLNGLPLIFKNFGEVSIVFGDPIKRPIGHHSLSAHLKSVSQLLTLSLQRNMTIHLSSLLGCALSISTRPFYVGRLSLLVSELIDFLKQDSNQYFSSSINDFLNSSNRQQLISEILATHFSDEADQKVVAAKVERYKNVALIHFLPTLLHQLGQELLSIRGISSAEELQTLFNYIVVMPEVENQIGQKLPRHWLVMLEPIFLALKNDGSIQASFYSQMAKDFLRHEPALKQTIFPIVADTLKLFSTLRATS